MKDRILRLCRRLDKFTLDEISTIAEDVDEAVLELLLLTLVKEGKLTLRNDLYFYNKQSFNKKYSILSYYPAKILDIVIRCFCLSIPAYKAKDVIGIAESSTMQLYYIFRELIYERQTNKLKSLYDKSLISADSRFISSALNPRKSSGVLILSKTINVFSIFAPFL